MNLSPWSKLVAVRAGGPTPRTSKAERAFAELDEVAQGFEEYWAPKLAAAAAAEVKVGGLDVGGLASEFCGGPCGAPKTDGVGSEVLIGDPVARKGAGLFPSPILG